MTTGELYLSKLKVAFHIEWRDVSI